MTTIEESGSMRADTVVGTTDETVIVSEASVFCDGGGGALGHPGVWLAFPDHGDGELFCPYCSRRFLRRTNA